MALGIKSQLTLAEELLPSLLQTCCPLDPGSAAVLSFCFLALFDLEPLHYVLLCPRNVLLLIFVEMASSERLP